MNTLNILSNFGSLPTNKKLFSNRKVVCLFSMLLFLSLAFNSLNAMFIVLTSKNGLPLNSTTVINALTDFKGDVGGTYHYGWGIVAYNQAGIPIPGMTYQYNSNKAYVGTPNPVRFAGTENIYTDDQFNNAVNTIVNSNPYIIMVHARGYSYDHDLTKPDPHPFVYHTNGRYYAFIHHGTINDDYANDMDTFTNGISPTLYNSVVQQNNLLENIDSAHYFAYIMAHFQDHNYDALQSLKYLNAHPAFSFNGESNRSFVLCDGFQSYAYRFYNQLLKSNIFNTSATQPYILLTQLSFEPVNIGTTANPILVPVDFIKDYYTQYIPVNGRASEVRFYDYPIGHTAFGSAVMYRRMSPELNWRWESFPILNTSLPATSVLAEFNSTSKSYWQNTVSRPLTNYLYRDTYTYLWSCSGIYNFTHTNGHKLNVPSTTYLNNRVIGKVVAENTSITIQSGLNNWVGYWFMENQSLADALGPNLSKVANVHGERWHYQAPQSNNTKDDPTPVPTVNANTLIMEFGKSYIINLKPGETSISNFHWNSNRTSGTKENITLLSNETLPEYYSFLDQDEYQSLTIGNIDENSGYNEIAVYAGLDCIGATKISSYPVQILAYTKGYEGLPLTFRAITSSKSEEEIALEGQIISNSKNNSLIAGTFDALSINVYPKENNNQVIRKSIINNVNSYPNPFNPTTTIKFSLTEESNVIVDLFNVKGQKIKTLVNQRMAMGTHGIVWNGDNQNGIRVGNGLYFFKIQSGNDIKTGKLLMLK